MSKLYWIKERDNPQLGVYYVAMGQMSKREAMRGERALYGANTMHSYETEQAYLNMLQKLRDSGEKVQ